MLSNIGPWQLLIVLGIVVIIFGTKKLRNMGSDIGSAVKGFKKAVNDDEEQSQKLEEKSTETTAAKTAQTEKSKETV